VVVPNAVESALPDWSGSQAKIETAVPGVAVDGLRMTGRKRGVDGVLLGVGVGGGDAGDEELVAEGLFSVASAGLARPSSTTLATHASPRGAVIRMTFVPFREGGGTVREPLMEGTRRSSRPGCRVRRPIRQYGCRKVERPDAQRPPHATAPIRRLSGAGMFQHDRLSA
jgi:hypothetical protein